MPDPTIFNVDVLNYINENLRRMRRARIVLDKLFDHADSYTDDARSAARTQILDFLQHWRDHGDAYPFTDGADGWHGTNRGARAATPTATFRAGFVASASADAEYVGDVQEVARPASPATLEVTWSNFPDGASFYKVALPQTAASFDAPNWFFVSGGWFRYIESETELTATVSLLTDEELEG